MQAFFAFQLLVNLDGRLINKERPPPIRMRSRPEISRPKIEKSLVSQPHEDWCSQSALHPARHKCHSEMSLGRRELTLDS